MKRVLAGVVLVLVFVVVVVALSGKNSVNTSPNISPSPDSGVVSRNNVVIRNFSFSPGTLTVKVGTTVKWTNNDPVIHSVKSSSFNSVGLNAGDTFMHTFSSIGIFNYNCGIHPEITGTVIVQ